MENRHPFTSEGDENDFFFQPIFDNLSVGMELYDKDGILTDLNRVGQELLGVKDKKEILGANFFDNPNFTDEMKERVRAGEGTQCLVEYDFDLALTYFATSLSGVKYVDTTVSVLRNEKGEVAKYIVECQDVTERVLWQRKYETLYAQHTSTLETLRKQNTEIEKRKKLHEKILNSIPFPVHIKDMEDDFRYVFCNEESKRMFGSLEKRTVYDIMTKHRADKIQESDCEVYTTGKPYSGRERIELKDGRVYETLVQKRVIEDGTRRLLLNVRWDKSHQYELERRAKALSVSLDALNAYTWYYDIEKDRLTYGDRFERVGRDPESINSMSKFIDCVHPDYQEYVRSVFDSVADRRDGHFSLEYRADINDDGFYGWWESRAVVETVMEDNVPRRYLFGMDINIEMHKKVEQSLLKKEEDMKMLIRQNELVLNNTNSGLAYISADYIVQWENISVCSKSLSYEAYKKGELCYKSAYNRTSPCDNCVMQRAFKSGQVEQIQFELHNERIIEVFATPVTNDEDVIEGVVIRVDDITERQQMIVELEKAKRQAVQSDKLKSAFLANMSHEIRTPLNAIVGFSDLLMTTEGGKEREEYIRIINANNELLLKLINDILDLSKIEAGSVELKYEEFDLASYFGELVSSMEQRVTNSNVRLISVSPYSSCMVKLDKNRLAQILTNYVTNSIKYTPKGFIEVGYEQVDGGIRLYVRDTGIGILEEKKSKVFHRFEKLDEFAQGTGLGLSICKAIVEACGGSIGFESEYGQGSLFWATLPCVVKIEDAESAPHDSEEGTAVENWEEPVAGEEGQELKTILIVEDIQSNYLLISALLRDKYKLLHAVNGLEAIEFVRTHPVDLVLMDMKMPVMDGLTAAREIRKFNTQIAIVALTAHAFESDRIAALEAGCNDYLVKPIDKVKLMRVLTDFCC